MAVSRGTATGDTRRPTRVLVMHDGSNDVYVSARAAADAVFLVSLLVVWLETIDGIRLWSKSGWCQVSTWTLHLKSSPFRKDCAFETPNAVGGRRSRAELSPTVRFNSGVRRSNAASLQSNPSVTYFTTVDFFFVSRTSYQVEKDNAFPEPNLGKLDI
jgi:hypothetical protein